MGETLKITTLKEALNDMARMPERKNDAPMRMPVSGVYKIKGVGDVITGRVEQGIVKPGEEVVFLPTHTAANACGGKVFTCEMHHKRCDDAKAGDNVGLNVKGLNKDNMPRTGDVMVYKKDTTLREAGTFTAQVHDHPGELKVGYTPVCFVRTGRSAVRMKNLNWKMGKETGGKKAEEPHCLKANEMAEVVFAPQQPLVVDSFKNCEGLSRVAIMEGNGVVMLGKVISTAEKTEDDANVPAHSSRCAPAPVPAPYSYLFPNLPIPCAR